MFQASVPGNRTASVQCIKSDAAHRNSRACRDAFRLPCALHPVVTRHQQVAPQQTPQVTSSNPENLSLCLPSFRASHLMMLRCSRGALEETSPIHSSVQHQRHLRTRPPWEQTRTPGHLGPTTQAVTSTLHPVVTLCYHGDVVHLPDMSVTPPHHMASQSQHT